MTTAVDAAHALRYDNLMADQHLTLIVFATTYLQTLLYTVTPLIALALGGPPYLIYRWVRERG